MNQTPLGGRGLEGVNHDVLDRTSSDRPHQTPPSSLAPLTATLIVRSVDRYDISFHDEIVVENSRDPECDLGRALFAKGITGKITIIDGTTGKPRTIVDIEKAARLSVKEGPLRFVPWETRPETSTAPEDGEGGS